MRRRPCEVGHELVVELRCLQEVDMCTGETMIDISIKRITYDVYIQPSLVNVYRDVLFIDSGIRNEERAGKTEFHWELNSGSVSGTVQRTNH